MSARSNILHRVSLALQNSPAISIRTSKEGALFDPIPPSKTLERFNLEFQLLKGEFYHATSWQEAHVWIKEIIVKNGFEYIAAAPHDDAAMVGRGIHANILSGNKDCGKSLARVDLGITECDYLIARTGSIILTAQSGFGRVLSVLPHAHLVVARPFQVVAELNNAYRLLQVRYGPTWPSMITIISGPSRTSDIEKTLVMGAHGPKKLFVLILDITEPFNAYQEGN